MKSVRDSVVDAALSYEGTRWRHQGRTPGVGLDCAGVVICSHRDAGLKMTDDPNYARLPDPDRMRRYIETNACKVDFLDALPGDFLWLRFNDNPQHLAVIARDGHIVHGYLKARRVLVQRLDAEIYARLVQTYRHRSL